MAYSKDRTAYIKILFMVCAFTSLISCSSTPVVPSIVDKSNFKEQGDQLIASDPGGVIAFPLSESNPSPIKTPNKETEKPLQYTINLITNDTPSIAEAFLQSSLLEQMKDQPTFSLSALEQRMRSDLTTAKDVLHSFGYYDGEVKGEVKEQKSSSGNATVEITFIPNTQYLVGKTFVAQQYPKNFSPEGSPKNLPASLADVGLAEQSPAIADNILAAVNKAHQAFRNNGFPSATIVSTRYTIDTIAKTLEAHVLIATGRLVRMGNITPIGKYTIHDSYLTTLQTWKYNQLWDQRLADNYREALRQSGLFQSASVVPGKKDTNDARNVVVNLTSLPERTIGFDVKYDSDFGAGAQLRWEHRNFTNNGDKLTIDIPVWEDLQQISARYRLPFFFDPKQDFVANLAGIKEKTDAYTTTAAVASAGIERRFTERFRASVLMRGEGGELKDLQKKTTSYYMVGLPVELGYDHTNSLLDATKGYRITTELSPNTGEYHIPFDLFRAKISGEFFIPLAKEDRLVLATRIATGGMVGASAQNVPPSARFYSGGGGSVRGYAHQSLSPRNAKRKPLGGSSFEEANIELRYKVSSEWGVVGFLDGGMAYEENMPKYLHDTRWGAGIGLRFYTAIGPIRFDIATPLNPRQDDHSFQIYFSIGQNF